MAQLIGIVRPIRQIKKVPEHLSIAPKSKSQSRANDRLDRDIRPLDYKLI